MYFDKFHIKCNQQNIFRRLFGKNMTNSKDMFFQIYQEIEEDVLTRIQAKAVITFGGMPGAYREENKDAEVLFVIFTLGKSITTYIENLFDNGNYVKGLLADAMADDYLYQMDEVLKTEIKKVCYKRKVHIINRLEAPTDISIEIQKTAYYACKAKTYLDLEINDSFMFDPIKTLCIVFEVMEGEGIFRLNHDCRKCDRVDCNTRNTNEVTIKIRNKDKLYEGKYCGEETLLAFLKRKGIYISAECAGRGTCGKCSVQCVEGELEITKADKKMLTEKELTQGYRLACQAYPNSDCMISIDQQEETMQILSSNVKIEKKRKSENAFGIAIDIGTTTLAMALVSLESGKVINHYTGVNHQRTYGTDVINRIFASNHGKKKELQSVILKDLLRGIKRLSASFIEDMQQLVIAGNTTMIYNLMGYDCEGLGEYPYTVKKKDMLFLTGEELFQPIFQEEEWSRKITCSVMVFPAISAFVGGDIVSGLYYKDFISKDKPNIFIDLGTNGELVIGKDHLCYATSVAAGPAFEGGNLSCGIASIEGAICKVDIDGITKIETIQNKTPVGICGTGIVEGVAELFENQIVDETGLLKDPYFEKGFFLAKDKNNTDIRITQKDIREIQLAKAAVAAGVEIMLEEYGITINEIEKIYVAGGFGYQLHVEKAKKIGLFPKSQTVIYEMIGNSSLLGGIRFLNKIEDREKEEEKIKRLCKNTKNIHLAEKKNFYEKYMKHINLNE